MREQRTGNRDSEFRIPNSDTRHPIPGAHDRALALAALTRASSLASASTDDASPAVINRPPVRVIRDTDPIYSSIAVDINFGEVFLQDANLFGIKVFNRLDNTRPNARFTEPKRGIEGNKTKMEFNCGLYIDPKTGDIYSAEEDTGDRIIVFPHDAKGNAAPSRELKVPHRAYAIAVDEEKQELYISIQYPPKVAVYPKTASGNPKPIRALEGEHTRMADVHGMAIDVRRQLLFVNNHGDNSDYRVAGTGTYNLPSITVYPLQASGDTPPLHVIEGSKTELNWPAAMATDPEHGELYVANDMKDSILVFHETDQGNVAPARILKGSKTGIKNPIGLTLDAKNNELWVASMGNSSATVYPRTASGNVAPLRTIRSAPKDKVSLKLGKPGGVAYDSKREEILVPN